MYYPGIGLLVPRTEASLALKLAKKKPKKGPSKKNLIGLYEVLAQGSSVIKTDDHTSIIKEPGKKELNIQNSDLANTGNNAEKQSELKDYAERRPKDPTGKTTEGLTIKHARDAKKKIEVTKR